MKKQTIKNFLIILCNIIIALAVGFAAYTIIKNDMNVYQQINLPPFSPPSEVFPIVWAILYVLMGISIGLIITTAGKNKVKAIIIYIIQLVLNFLWSPIFFSLQYFTGALVIIILLWIAVLTMILAFNKINKKAAILQIPYFLWLTFATYLNIMIVLLN